MTRKTLFILSIIWFALFSQAHAKLELPALVGDNMVLQRDRPVRIWGLADKGRTVTVRIAGQKKKTVAAEDGRWELLLDPVAAGGPYDMTIAAEDTVTVKNILFGDVWVCGGQSNMQFNLGQSQDGAQALASADFPKIRFFSIKNPNSTTPLDTCKGRWQVCSPNFDALKSFTAVGFYFGREIHQKTGIPIGLIHNARGGTSAESWISPDTLKNNSRYRYYFDLMASWDARKAEFQADYDARLKKFQEAVAAAKAAGNPPPDPVYPHAALAGNNLPSVNYNSLLHPLLRYTIFGVIWYQGENNAADKLESHYYGTFSELIRNWRRDWGEGPFPFYFVQLAGFGKIPTKPENPSWAVVREAQRLALTLPNTGMALALDLGDRTNIHPPDKLSVGRRLALWALAKDYGFKDLVYSGPLYREMRNEGDKIRIMFDCVGDGLIARGDGPLKQFAIAGDDGVYVWADARIDGKTVLVWNDQVPRPRSVRYAWARNPDDANLYNKNGLPAAPFQTERLSDPAAAPEAVKPQSRP